MARQPAGTFSAQQDHNARIELGNQKLTLACQNFRMVAVVELIVRPSYDKGSYNIIVATDQRDVMIRYLLISSSYP